MSLELRPVMCKCCDKIKHIQLIDRDLEMVIEVYEPIGLEALEEEWHELGEILDELTYIEED